MSNIKILLYSLPSVSLVSEIGGSLATYCFPLNKLLSTIDRLSSNWRLNALWSSWELVKRQENLISHVFAMPAKDCKALYKKTMASPFHRICSETLNRIMRWNTSQNIKSITTDWMNKKIVFRSSYAKQNEKNF